MVASEVSKATASSPLPESLEMRSRRHSHLKSHWHAYLNWLLSHWSSFFSKSHKSRAIPSRLYPIRERTRFALRSAGCCLPHWTTHWRVPEKENPLWSLQDDRRKKNKELFKSSTSSDNFPHRQTFAWFRDSRAIPRLTYASYGEMNNVSSGYMNHTSRLFYPMFSQRVDGFTLWFRCRDFPVFSGMKQWSPLVCRASRFSTKTNNLLETVTTAHHTKRQTSTLATSLRI